MSLVLNILLVLILVLVINICYTLKCPLMSIKKYFESLGRYYKNKSKFVFTAKLAKETILLLTSLTIGVIIYLYFTTDFGKNLCQNSVNTIRDHFTSEYPLITTIIGAFIALIINYLFVRAKVYVSPDIIFDKQGDKRFFTWYIENRSIFGIVNISIEAHKMKVENGDAVNKGTLTFRKDNASFLAGRWSANNDNAVCFTLSEEQLKPAALQNPDFDFILVYVKFTHALSNITNVIKKQYLIEDIYVADLIGTKCYAKAEPNAPEFELKTLKAEALKRYMIARKYVSVSIAFIFAWFLVCLTMHFENVWIVSATKVLSETAAFIIMEFSILRFLYRLNTETDKNDKNYAYRLVNKIN